MNMLDLLSPETPFGAIPFSKVKTEDFLPALETALDQAREAVNRIASDPSEPNFCNTLVALEWAGHDLDLLSSLFFNLHSANTNPDMQAIAQEFSPKLTAFQNDILLNEALFARVETVWENREAEKLDEEDLMLLDKTYRGFLRNGARLSPDKKEELRKLDEQLARATVTFSEHVLQDTQDFVMLLQEDELDGLPESAREGAAEAARERDLNGYAFTLDTPSYLGFMTYSTNRKRRKELFLAYGRRGFANPETDNRTLISSIASMRRERARLLGFRSHADFVLQERMAKDPATVRSFLDDLLTAARPAGERDVLNLSTYAREEDGITDFNRWDFHHYAERLRQKELGLDEEALKPYFPLNQVLDGVFQVAHRLYGLSFILNEDLEKYHPDVQVYEVRDRSDAHLALFYADFFPRKGKRAGAWMTSFKPQRKGPAGEERPHISIVCNFTKPTASKPSLLTFQEVLTLFHEFGHSLHGMLARGRYASLSGTNVYWDFVELPSQILENWCYEPEALRLFARHFQTGEPLPDLEITQLGKSIRFLEGYATCRQLGFGLLDMAWHGPEYTNGSPEELERNALKPAELFPPLEETLVSPAFSHIFAGGYAAGYYSYKWAEVLDADAFGRFREEGIFNSRVAADFEQLLSAGGSIHPATLFERFRGRGPRKEALLERAGLI